MSNEWYTPAKYIEAAREVMGSIDLDPASCALANQTVKAARYYTQEDDGLSQAWYGNVWLNPPYGKTGNKSNIGLFTRKLLDAYEQGYISQAVLLSTARSDTSWFAPLWEYPICFTDHHVNFDCKFPSSHYDGKMQHIHGTIFVYLGANEQRFIDVFSQFGRIAKAVDVPVAKPRQLELVS